MLIRLLAIIVVLSVSNISLGSAKKKNFDENNDIVFELYTRERPYDYQDLKLSYGDTVGTMTTFDPRRPTRIYIHGFQAKRKTFQRYVNAYMDNGDFNVIVVNWTKGSSTFNYFKARNRVNKVGEAVGDFIDYLVMNGMNINDLIVIGHSLGAHIAGIAGENVSSGRIPIIVGLDPADPLFKESNTDGRLDPSDADYVQVIHTAGGAISVSYRSGHSDFYPNAGTDQPGCDGLIFDKCSHVRAHWLYIASLYSNNTFVGINCESYHEIKHGTCTRVGPDALMGGERDQLLKPNGVYYLETNSAHPYVQSPDSYKSITIK